MIKNILFAAMMMLSTGAVAEDVPSWNRQTYQSECNVAGVKAGEDALVVKAICECATQYVSHVKNNQDRFAEFTVQINDPVVQQGVNVCVAMAQAYPREFLQNFYYLDAQAN